MVREVISIHIGQAGVQIGTSCWELYCLEHGIQPDGEMPTDATVEICENSSSALFSATQAGKHVPRALLVDLEPTVVDAVRRGTYGQLFAPTNMMSGTEDAASNYMRGHYTVGRDAVDSAMERIRQLAENCSSLEGILLFHSLAGGTGAGLGSLLLERLSVAFRKTLKFALTVFPSPRISTVTVEPYNALLAAESMSDHCQCQFMVDNEALYGICHQALDLERPTYTDLNRILAQVASSLTAPLRFSGALNVGFEELHNNLVPYARVHFATCAYAPLTTADKANHEDLTIGNITAASFEPHNVMLSCDPRAGHYLACALLYRGNPALTDVNAAAATIRNNKALRFVEYSPGFKIGVNYEPPTVVPGSGMGKVQRALCTFANTSAVGQVWSRLEEKWDVLWAKRAFVHWFAGEGGSDDDWGRARSDVSLLLQDYAELTTDPIDDQEE